MSIDPNKKYVFDAPGHAWRGQPVTQLHRFDAEDSYRWVGVCNGGLLHFKDDDPNLREVDPVLYYINHYRAVPGSAFDSLSDCIRSHGAALAIARTATHQSGKVRQIPLDATEDPEGGDA